MKRLLIVVVLALACGRPSSAAPRAVTHEDIRDAILSFVHMFREMTDKLERHEMRERQLGEQLKKALSTLDKRERSQDTALSNTNSVVSRILEGIQRLEKSVDENNRQKDNYSIDMAPLQLWMSNVERMIVENDRYVEKETVVGLEQSMNSRLDRLTSAVERLEEQMRQSALQNSIGGDIEKLHSKIDTQLSTQNSWNDNMMSTLDDHRKKISNFHEVSKQEVMDKISEEMDALKNEIGSTLEKEALKLENNLGEINSSMNRVHSAVVDSISEGNGLTNGFYDIVQKTFEQLSTDVKALSKVEKVLIQTSDNVMDTKRRIEYGVQQILLEVGDLIQLQGKEINNTMNSRFDQISEKILESQSGGLKNLSAKIETEISQVWRQIGIMYQQLTASAGALDRLQQQTETYVNGSLRTMDSMEGKVGQITGRMSEVDENLNFLLGRLSLVTQEFDQIKSALTSALDKIRSSFNTVQDKIKDVGPGPNPIDANNSGYDNTI